MTTNNQYQLHTFSFGRTVLFGAGLGFILVSSFLSLMYFLTDGGLGLGAMVVLPLSTVTIGGAFTSLRSMIAALGVGGVFFYLMDFVRQHGTGAKVLANIISALVYFAGLWISLVFALAITGHWD